MKVILVFASKNIANKEIEVPDVPPTPKVIYNIATRTMHGLDTIGDTYVYTELPYGICGEKDAVTLHDIKL